jgi:hypothetical protein
MLVWDNLAAGGLWGRPADWGKSPDRNKDRGDKRPISHLVDCNLARIGATAAVQIVCV